MMSVNIKIKIKWSYQNIILFDNKRSCENHPNKQNNSDPIFNINIFESNKRDAADDTMAFV